jgi:diaminopimelate decarboxylase
MSPQDVLDLFPPTTSVENGELVFAGVSARDLAEEFGTPLLVYCEETLRRRARAYRTAAPDDALVLYGTKAFPNVAVLALLASEGLGADVWTEGELAFALAAGVPSERIFLNGTYKSDAELGAAVDADVAFVVLDSHDEVERAARLGVRRVLLRGQPGVEPKSGLSTGHRGSKFGLEREQLVEAARDALAAGLELAGLHVHVGSQLPGAEPLCAAIGWLAETAAECRRRLGWQPAVIDLGGGLPIRYLPGETCSTIEAFVGTLVDECRQAWQAAGLDPVRLVFEPGRSLVGPAGLTLYRVGLTKPGGASAGYVVTDGGISDNPRPHIYGARYSAVLANRATEEPTAAYTLAGKHCEADVLIEGAALPQPRAGDVAAVPSTGAYTLAMGSNYNAVPRAATVLVRDGTATLVQRRETVADLLACQVAANVGDATGNGARTVGARA